MPAALWHASKKRTPGSPTSFSTPWSGGSRKRAALDHISIAVHVHVEIPVHEKGRTGVRVRVRLTPVGLPPGRSSRKTSRLKARPVEMRFQHSEKDYVTLGCQTTLWVRRAAADTAHAGGVRPLGPAARMSHIWLMRSRLAVATDCRVRRLRPTPSWQFVLVSQQAREVT